MTIQQLKYIVALDEERHYVRAAQRCRVAQPTLTVQVKKLENELGIQLFQRKSSPLSPTPQGSQLIAKARQILSEVQTLYDFASDEHLSVKGEFRLGIIPTVSTYLLPALLRPLHEKLPSTTWKVRELQTSQIISGLIDRKLDIGILSTPINEDEIREIPLYNERFLLYTPVEHALSIRKRITTQDIPVDELLLLEEGHCFREQMLNICSQVSREEKNLEIRSGSLETLRQLVRQGQGVTLVPELLTTLWPDEGLIEFTNPQPVREISIVCHQHFPRETLLNTLVDTIQEVIPEKMRSHKNAVKIVWQRNV